MNGKHSVTLIAKSLSKASCTHIQENYYIFDYYDEILSDLGEELDIDFSKKFLLQFRGSLSIVTLSELASRMGLSFQQTNLILI